MARTPIATDDFNRANGAVGSNWSYIRNTAWTANPPEVTSNALTARANADNYQVCRWNGTGSFADDQYATLTLGGLGYFGTPYRQGAVVRCSADQDTAADFYAYYVLDDAASFRTAILFKVVNGTYTALNTSTATSWDNGDTIEIEAEGTTIRGFKNGTETVSVTDSDISTGKPGFVIAGDGGGPPNADNWSGGDLSAGVTVTPSVGTYRLVGQTPEMVMEGMRAPQVGTLRFVGAAPTLRLAVPEATAPRVTGNNTASGSWAVGYPAHSTGDLVLIGLASDANVTHGTLPGGPNSETAVVLSQHEGDAGTATVRASLWYWIATDNEVAGTVTVTPSASEQWSASAVVIPAGTFDPANPMQDGGTGVGTTGANTLPPFTATLAGGRLGYFAACDADTITGTASGWRLSANQDIGAVSSSFVLRDAATTASESVSGGAVTGVDDGRVSIGFVINPRARALPEPATFRFVGQEPTVTVQTAGGATVSPVVGTYQFVGQAPTVGFTHSVAPSVGTLVFAGQQPSVGSTQAAAPSVGTVRFDGLQPTVSYTTNAWASPTAGTYRFDGQQPSATVSEAGAASPLVGTLRFVGDAPSVTYTDNVWVTPSVGTLRFVGQQLPLFDTSALIDFDTPAKSLLIGADQQTFRVLVRKTVGTNPTVDIDLYEGGAWVADLVSGTAVTSTTGQIVSATWNASLLADISGAGVQAFIYGHSSADAQVEIGAVEWVAELEAVQTPTVGTLRFAGAAPSVAYTDHVTVTPTAGTYRFDGQQPSVTSSAAQSVAPSVGTVLVVGQQPTVSYTDHQSVAPTVGTVQFAGQQPTISSSAAVTVAPSVGTVRFDGQQPSSAVTDHVWITPTAGEVRFGGYAPVLSATAHQWTVPSSGELRVVGQQPTTAISDHRIAAPQVGTLRFAGNAPTLSETQHQTVAPSAGTVRVTGNVPVLSQTAHVWVVPSAGTLRIVGQIPYLGRLEAIEGRTVSIIMRGRTAALARRSRSIRTVASSRVVN